MTQAGKAPTTTLRFVETPEYRRLVYKMFRMQGEYRPGRTYNFPAWKALELTRRYVEALQR